MVLGTGDASKSKAWPLPLGSSPPWFSAFSGRPNRLTGRSNTDCCAGHTQNFWLGCFTALGICICNKFPGKADTAVPQTTGVVGLLGSWGNAVWVLSSVWGMLQVLLEHLGGWASLEPSVQMSKCFSPMMFWCSSEGWMRDNYFRREILFKTEGTGWKSEESQAMLQSGSEQGWEYGRRQAVRGTKPQSCQPRCTWL